MAREYLQARILASLQRAGAMLPLAFQGGTALRFLYSLPRHSEDLDFALEQAADRYDFRAYLHAIQRDLRAEGYTLDVKLSDQKVVHHAFVRVRGLLHELGLSPHASEVLAIKIEVDTRPPGGATLATSVVRRHATLHLQHHDRASLFAGKLHAVLQRPYPKGRDFYDLVWYLSDATWPAPNLDLLNNALAQSGWRAAPITPESWPRTVAERVREVAWDALRADVAPFLELPGELERLRPDTLLALLEAR